MINHVGSEAIASNRPRNSNISLSPTWPDSGITSEIKTPAEAVQALSESRRNWLSALREMRGRVLFHEGGHETVFKTKSGLCFDADPLDAHAYHIVLRSARDIVACGRVSVLNPEVPGYLATMLGQRRLEGILSQMGAAWGTTCEASRWIVALEFRNQGLGPRVVAGGWIVAQILGMHRGFVLACTRDSQDKLLCRMGAKPVDGIALVPARVINDSLRLLYFDASNPAYITQRRMDRSTIPLDLPFWETMRITRFPSSRL